MNYLENVYSTAIAVNSIAFRYRDGKAWDNKKKKTVKRHYPRGEAFRKVAAMARLAEYQKLIDGMPNRT